MESVLLHSVLSRLTVVVVWVERRRVSAHVSHAGGQTPSEDDLKAKRRSKRRRSCDLVFLRLLSDALVSAGEMLDSDDIATRRRSSPQGGFGGAASPGCTGLSLNSGFLDPHTSKVTLETFKIRAHQTFLSSCYKIKVVITEVNFLSAPVFMDFSLKTCNFSSVH